MYEKIKNDIAQEYYVKNYPNDGQRFVAWYLRNIHNLDTFEAKACITDGAGDKQIDAVYIDDQSPTIYIIQGKFYKGDTVDAEPLREVTSSWIQIKNLAKLREAAMLDVIHSATDAKRVLMRNFSQNMHHITEHYQKSDFQMMLDFKGEKDVSRKTIDAFQTLVYITNSVQTECEGYAMLGEYEPCKECLEEFKSFIVENKLNE